VSSNPYAWVTGWHLRRERALKPRTFRVTAWRTSHGVQLPEFVVLDTNWLVVAVLAALLWRYALRFNTNIWERET